MNVPLFLLAGLIATLVLTVVLTGSQYLGWTRISLALMLGTILTPDRHRALFAGTIVHFLLGLTFAALYAAFFALRPDAPWWIAIFGGLLHGLAMLLVFMPMLPGLHPRMASEHHGPEPTAALEPPGPFARNYGPATAVFAIVAHIAYGTVFGLIYAL